MLIKANSIIRGLCSLFALCLCSLSLAAPCPGRFVNPVTEICWSCLFPLTIGQHAVVSSRVKSPKPAAKAVCTCPGEPLPKIGLSLGFWEPLALVDVTRTPFCFPSLGGLSLEVGKMFPQGFQQNQPERRRAFYHVHWIHYPLLSWLKLISDPTCQQHGDWDDIWLTEIDPTWHNDSLALLLAPEALALSLAPVQLACTADAIAAWRGLPFDRLFWCLGAQGGVYPLTGHVNGHQGGLPASLHLAERYAFKLHREGLLWDSDPKTPEGICQLKPHLIMPKSRYRYQMTFPRPTHHHCYPFGHTIVDWAHGHSFPGKGETFGYLIWRRRSCCAGL